MRGYQTASIGPKDIYGNATAARSKIVGNAELFYPILKGDKSVRVERLLRRRPDLRHPARQQHAVQRPRAGIPELPLFGRRWARVEFADRPAQVQLRLARSTTSRGQDPAFPVPGRVRCSRAHAGYSMQQENPVNRSMRHLSRVAIAHACRADAGCRRSAQRRRIQDRLRQHRAAVPRGRARQARAAEAGEGIREPRRRDPEADQAGARSADGAREGRRDDVARPTAATRSATSPT